MKINKFRLCFVILCVILLACGATTAAPQEEQQVWQDTYEFEVKTFAWEEANVYAEPNLEAKVVGTLPKSPQDVDDDVTTIRARILTDGKKEDFKIFKAWWLISEPLKGWVEGEKLGLWNSDFLYGGE